MSWKMQRVNKKSRTVIVRGVRAMSTTTDYQRADTLARRALPGAKLAYTGEIDGVPSRFYRA